MHDDHGTDTIRRDFVTGKLTDVLDALEPDVKWIVNAPPEVDETLHCYRHGLTTTIITVYGPSAQAPEGFNKHGDAHESFGTHSHATEEGAQSCIESKIIAACQGGGLVVSGPYVYVPPAPPNPLLAMLARAMGVQVAPMSPENVGTQDDEFGSLADQLRAMGLDLDGSGES